MSTVILDSTIVRLSKNSVAREDFPLSEATVKRAVAGDWGAPQAASTTCASGRLLLSSLHSSGIGSTKIPDQPTCAKCHVCDNENGSLAPTSTKYPAESPRYLRMRNCSASSSRSRTGSRPAQRSATSLSLR